MCFCTGFTCVSSVDADSSDITRDQADVDAQDQRSSPLKETVTNAACLSAFVKKSGPPEAFRHTRSLSRTHMRSFMHQHNHRASCFSSLMLFDRLFCRVARSFSCYRSISLLHHCGRGRRKPQPHWSLPADVTRMLIMCRTRLGGYSLYTHTHAHVQCAYTLSALSFAPSVDLTQFLLSD